MLSKEQIERTMFVYRCSEDVGNQAILAISLQAELAEYKAKLDKVREIATDDCSGHFRGHEFDFGYSSAQQAVLSILGEKE
jgi:hypothetical protein